MARLSALASLLLSLVIPCSATSAPLAKEVEVNGVRLQYIEEGTGDPVVFVHGCCADLRAWDPVIREQIAKKYRFIAYTQRYYGTAPWKNDGKEFSIATLADDLAKFITSLNAGPVHVVTWSYGGQVVTTAAVQNPSLIRSLVLYEASVLSVLPEDSSEGKAAREEAGKWFAPAAAANKAGDPVKANRLLVEAAFQLPPGGFGRESEEWQRMLDGNARTTPLMFAAPRASVTCDMLRSFTQPVLVMRGEKTLNYYTLISEGIAKCAPGAQQAVLPNVNHDGPYRDPAAFSAAVLEFLSKR